jgi:hypothetical protein
VLDSPGLPWRVDHTFEERLPNGRWRDVAVVAFTYAGPPLGDRQAWLGTVERLDLALLVEAILPQIRTLPTGRR